MTPEDKELFKKWWYGDNRHFEQAVVFLEQLEHTAEIRGMKRMADELINIKLYTGDGDPEVDEEIPDGVVEAFFRQEQRQKAQQLIEEESHDTV